MPRSPIRVACVLFAALSCASLARAIPSAANSTLPRHVLLVGRLGDLADTTAGACSMVVRDLANNPINRCVVELRVLNCFGTRLSSEPYAPATTIRCETSGVLQTTDIHGEVRMTAVGASRRSRLRAWSSLSVPRATAVSTASARLRAAPCRRSVVAM